MTTNACLRGLRIDDAPNVLAAFLSAEDMSRQCDVRTLEQAQQYVARLIDAEGPHHAWGVADATSLVGLVVVTVDAENLNGWFWYWMSASHRRRGLTRRAATAVANWALSDDGLHRLELGHRATNAASGAVARARVSSRKASSERNSWSAATASTCSRIACGRTTGQPPSRCL